MLFSVLTCVLGAPDALEATRVSLLPHLSPQVSWTLKFAANTPAEFIAHFEHPHVHCLQSRDTSVYDAMNQGLHGMEADYYCVLGAGDTLQADGLQQLLQRLAQPDAPAACFAPIVYAGSGTVWTPSPHELPVRMSCPHPGAVLGVGRSREAGGFDPGYKIAGDYDLISRYVRRFGFGENLTQPLVRFAGGGLSDTRAFEGTLEEELIRMRIWKAHEYAVHARLMRRSALIACSLFDQVAQLHSKP